MRKSSRIIKYQNSEKYQKQLSAEKKDTLFVYNTQHNNIFFFVYTVFSFAYGEYANAVYVHMHRNIIRNYVVYNGTSL